MNRRCMEVTASGAQCNGRPRQDGYCFAHSPSLQGQLDESRREGGRNRSKLARAQKRVPKDMKGVQAILMELIRDVHGSADMDLRTRAVTISTLDGSYVKVHEAGEMEGRIADLEARAEAGQPRRA